MTETKPQRRRYQFSLRTLFVLVTASCILAGWLSLKERRIVGQREEFANTLQQYEKSGHGRAVQSPLLNPDKSLSPVRRFFGDHNYSILLLPITYNKDLVDQAVSLFPEAQIEQWKADPPIWNRRQTMSRAVIQEMK